MPLLIHAMPAISAALIVVAQAVPSGLLSNASEIGALGVLLVYLWLVNTKTLPGLLERFKEEAEREREHHREQMTTVVSAFKEEKATCREAMADALRQTPSPRRQDERSKTE